MATKSTDPGARPPESKFWLLHFTVVWSWVMYITFLCLSVPANKMEILRWPHGLLKLWMTSNCSWHMKRLCHHYPLHCTVFLSFCSLRASPGCFSRRIIKHFIGVSGLQKMKIDAASPLRLMSLLYSTGPRSYIQPRFKGKEYQPYLLKERKSRKLWPSSKYVKDGGRIGSSF